MIVWVQVVLNRTAIDMHLRVNIIDSTYDESFRTATTGEPTCRPCYSYVQHWSSKTTLIFVLVKNTRYGLWACEACVLRAKISRGWLEKPILMEKNLLLSSLRSQKGK